MPRTKTVPIESARKEGKPMAAKEKDFSKVIISDNEGNKYTLEFNARVVKNMERRGFKIDTDYPHTMIDDLFLGAFQMHHKGMMPEKVKELCRSNRSDAFFVRGFCWVRITQYFGRHSINIEKLNIFKGFGVISVTPIFLCPYCFLIHWQVLSKHLWE